MAIQLFLQHQSFECGKGRVFHFGPFYTDKEATPEK